VAQPSALQVEVNGINVIPDDERHGTPRSLFWPWATSSISIFNVSIAALLAAFGMGFIGAAVAAILGITISFFLVGLISLAGKRAAAPTMMISRAAFGVRGNALPTAVSYLTLVGWEIVVVATTVMAAVTVFQRLGWAAGTLVEVVVFALVVAVVVIAGVVGIRLVTRFQTVVTVASILLTVAYIAMTIGTINWSALTAAGEFGTGEFIGAVVIAMAAFGLGWTNSGADYSRYLPRTSSGRAIIGWTTFAGSVVPVVLVVYGLMLVASDPAMAGALSENPIGALISLLPTSALVLLPFLLIMSMGATGSGAMDLYSSGFSLLTLGLKVPRAAAAGIDGVLMTLGSIYLLWFAGSFFGPFESFLIFLGVPLAAWSGVFIADAISRHQDYVGADLDDPKGRYGSVGRPALTSMIAGSVIGWGLVVSDARTPLLSWQGFIFDAMGVAQDSLWRDCNAGVLIALLVGFAGAWAFGRRRIARQESGQAEEARATARPGDTQVEARPGA